MQSWKKSIKLPQLIVIILIVVVVSISTNVVLGWYRQGEFHLFVVRISRELTDTFHRPVADKAIPIISDINVSKITTDSAKISWRTDEPTKTVFFLGADTNYNLWQESFERLATDHWISKLPLLDPSTTYHFKIEAVDEAGNETASQDQTFATLELETATSSQQSALPQEPASSPPPESCQNECDQLGLKQCIKGILSVGPLVFENYGYQVCGNFDTDSCLEWGEPIDCPQNAVCENGACIE